MRFCFQVLENSRLSQVIKDTLIFGHEFRHIKKGVIASRKFYPCGVAIFINKFTVNEHV